MLGAPLADPEHAAAHLSLIIERFGSSQPFYDLKHGVVFAAMRELHGLGRPVDAITLGETLKTRGALQDVGGLAFISGLSDIGAPAALDYYLDIVWDRYIARTSFNQVTDWAARVFDSGAVPPEALVEIRRRVEQLEAEASRHAAQPRFLKKPGDFGDVFWSQFFGAGTETPGWDLPIRFGLKIRTGETTLVSGDDGSGKSTLLNFFLLHLLTLLPPGQRGCLASFEMPPPVSLWILVSQMLGHKHQPDSSAGHASVAGALAWLHSRLLLYDFLGIGDWRDVLDTFRYAAEKEGARIFVLDSVMRIGIADDDYALQATVAAQLANFAKAHDAHVFHVIHENKADAKGKARIRGSKLWSANADNVLRVERNVAKAERISKAEWQLQLERNSGEPDQEAIRKHESAVAGALREWDSHIVHQKQRFPGTQQNASKRIWFDPNSFQFRSDPTDPAINWLSQWTNKKEIT